MKSKFKYIQLNDNGKVIIKKITNNSDKHVKTEYFLQWHICTNEFVVYSERKSYKEHEIIRKRNINPLALIQSRTIKKRVYSKEFNEYMICFHCNKEIDSTKDYKRLFIKTKSNDFHMKESFCLDCYNKRNVSDNGIVFFEKKYKGSVN